MRYTQVLSDEACEKLSKSEELDASDGDSLWINISAVSLSSSSGTVSIKIPRDLESVQAMEFLGFTSERAQQVLDRFCSALERFPHAEIFDFAKGHIRSGRDASGPDEDWEDAIESMGIAQHMKDQILDPKFIDIRLTETAMHWVLDTVKAKYAFLNGLDFRILTRGSGDKGSVHLESLLEASYEGKEHEPSITVTVSYSKPEITTVDQTIAPDEIELMKGGDAKRLEKAIRLDMSKPQTANRTLTVASMPPGDFSEYKFGLYLTEQREVAQRHAEYARVRLREQAKTFIDAAILHIIIPKSLVADSVQVSGPDWQEFVWSNRLHWTMPEHLVHFMNNHSIRFPIAEGGYTTSKAGGQVQSADDQCFACVHLEEVTTGSIDSGRAFILFLWVPVGLLCRLRDEEPQGPRLPAIERATRAAA